MPILGARGGASSRGLGQFTGNPAAPTSPVAGYHLWLDADNAASFTYSSGSVVSQWTDRSANAFTFTTGGTASQPSRTGTQNSKSTLVFDGDTDYLLSTAAASTWKYLHDGTQTTIFLVMKSNETSGTGNWVMSTKHFDKGFYISIDEGNTVEAQVAAEFPVYILNYDVPLPVGSHNVHTYKLDANNATNNNRIVNYFNSSAPTPKVLNNSWSTAFTGDPTSSLYLGTGYGGAFIGGGYPQYMFYGEIAEIIIYKSLLSDSDRIANTNYLRAKWGI
jgi:hypothetical protein